jgi:hypothetical protein
MLGEKRIGGLKPADVFGGLSAAFRFATHG